MCIKCYKEKYGKDENSISINISHIIKRKNVMKKSLLSSCLTLIVVPLVPLIIVAMLIRKKVSGKTLKEALREMTEPESLMVD